MLAWITDAGRECVDQGGVSAYLRAQRQCGESTVHNRNYNMGGSGNVLATAAAAGAVAMANATLNIFNLDYARLLARAVGHRGGIGP